MLNIGTYFLEKASLSDAPAVYHDGRCLSYRALDDKSTRLANALLADGVCGSDKIAFLMKNGIDWAISWYACQKIGAAVVLLHSRLNFCELLPSVELSAPDVLIYDEEYEDKVMQLKERAPGIRLFIRCGSDDHSALKQMIACGSRSDVSVAISGSAPCVILFTSGTTGLSKAIVRSYDMMRIYASLFEASQVCTGEVMLTPAPLYHAAGLCCMVKLAVLGGAVALLNGFDERVICESIEAYNVTQLALVPPRSYLRLYESSLLRPSTAKRIRMVHLTAGKATKECVETIFRMFPNTRIRTSWGSTECSNVTSAILSREQVAANPQLTFTVGKLNRFSEIMLINEDGAAEEQGAGEAYVKSPIVFNGYLKDPTKTAACFDGEWFKTEDILSRDGEGYYYVVGRKKDVIKTGGENVYAQEIEQVILSLPSVQECAVVGVPDERFEEAIAAAIVLAPGCTLESEALLRFCEGRLARFKKPRYLAVMEQLPKNDIGKVRKKVLKEQAEKLFCRIA